MRNSKGFTLIELLVVIAIIGLLSTLAVVALNSARAKSRDSKRISDIKQVQTALELYYADQNGYPAANTAVTLGGANSDVLSEDGFSGAAGDTVYMGQVPDAPTPADSTLCQTGTNNAYLYSASTANVGDLTSSSYSIGFCLGGPTGDLPAGLQTASPNGITSQP
jgi:prepilin-type N-terminal cleavage/methylation domain-containing protein